MSTGQSTIVSTTTAWVSPAVLVHASDCRHLERYDPREWVIHTVPNEGAIELAERKARVIGAHEPSFCDCTMHTGLF